MPSQITPVYQFIQLLDHLFVKHQ